MEKKCRGREDSEKERRRRGREDERMKETPRKEDEGYIKNRGCERTGREREEKKRQEIIVC